MAEQTDPEAQRPSEQHPQPQKPPEGAGQGESIPAPEGAQSVQPQPREDDDPAALRKEAAGYRRKLREAESDNERLSERVAELQRRGIEGQVSGPGKLADGADLWLTGVTVADLCVEDGAIDPEKVKAALQQTLADHPSWKDRTQVGGLGGGARGTQPTGPSFGEALKNPSLHRDRR